MNDTTSDPLAQFRAKGDIFTPSNLISFMRVVMVLPAIFAIVDEHYLLAAAIFVVAFISDLLDGLLARKLNDVSELGKVIDPLADKIFVAGVVITMVYVGLLPVWFVALILARDLIIVVAGIWATRRFRVVLPSNYPGKAAVLTISLTLFLIMAGLNGTPILFMEMLSVALMAISLFVYGRRLVGLIRQDSRATRPASA